MDNQKIEKIVTSRRISFTEKNIMLGLCLSEERQKKRVHAVRFAKAIGASAVCVRTAMSRLHEIGAIDRSNEGMPIGYYSFQIQDLETVL